MAKEGKYGEQTKMVNYRIPLSLVSEINQMVKLRLLEFEKSIVIKNNPPEWATKYREPLKSQKEYYTVPEIKEVSIDEQINPAISMVEKKSNPTDIVIEDVIFDPMREKVKALQEMANMIKDNSSIGVSKNKVAVEDEYDCIEVTSGLPSTIDRIYYGTRDKIAFLDKDDISVYYIEWEGKHYKFSNSSEFSRFAKDKNIK